AGMKANDDEPFALEYRLITADGEERWVLDRGHLVHGAGGRRWCDGAIFDITERRAAEEALRNREIEQARTEEMRASLARTVRVAQEKGSLAIEVRDDGKGGAVATPGSGLAGLADRVGALDGSLEVESPPGEGTLLRAVLPL